MTDEWGDPPLPGERPDASWLKLHAGLTGVHAGIGAGVWALALSTGETAEQLTARIMLAVDATGVPHELAAGLMVAGVACMIGAPFAAYLGSRELEDGGRAMIASAAAGLGFWPLSLLSVVMHWRALEASA